MHFLFAGSFLTISLCAALPLHSLESWDQPWSSSLRAAYFLDDDPAGNYIAAFPISNSNGTVSSPVRTSTNGVGAIGDTAISQHAVVVSGDYLFTVNTGSDTVVMFLIDPLDPLHPKPVGNPTSSLGTKPVSVAYSSTLNQLCTVNGGATPNAVAGVTCFSVDRQEGLTALGPLRLIPQPTDPTPVPSVALYPNISAPLAMDILFNPSSTALFTTIRSNGLYPGQIYAYPVTEGQVSTNCITSSFPTLPFIFSLNFLGSDQRLLTTNPHLLPVAAVLEVSSSFEITIEKNISIPQQQATCWIAVAPEIESIFLTDPFNANIAILDLTTTEMTGDFSFQEAKGGASDIAIDRNWFYVLQAGPVTPQLLVYDIAGDSSGQTPLLVQSFDIYGALGMVPSLLGLAIYPSPYFPRP